MKIKERALKVIKLDGKERKQQQKEKRYPRIVKTVRGCLVVAAALSCSACGGMAVWKAGQGEMGWAMVTPESIRATNDGMNGAITNTRISPDLKSPYWQNREKETGVRMLKFGFGAAPKAKGGK